MTVFSAQLLSENILVNEGNRVLHTRKELLINNIILYPGGYNAFSKRFHFKQVFVLVEWLIICKNSCKLFQGNNTSNILIMDKCKNTSPLGGEEKVELDVF